LGTEFTVPELPNETVASGSLDSAKKAIKEIVIPFCKGARSHIHFTFQITIGENEEPKLLYFKSHERTAEISVEPECVKLKQTNVEDEVITAELDVNNQERTINCIRNVITKLMEYST
jgi:hypothetical protein